MLERWPMERFLDTVAKEEKDKSAKQESCWKCLLRVKRPNHRRKFQWRSVLRSLRGCFCCYFDFCPRRIFLLIISALRIVQHLTLYIWHTLRLQDFTSKYYVANYLDKDTPDLKTTDTFQFCWHTCSMVISIVQICLYVRLFTAALLFYPRMGWIWFYGCWAVSLCGAVLSGIEIWFLQGLDQMESVADILSTVFVFYEMWLWAFHSKQIILHGDKVLVTSKPRETRSFNPKIYYEQKEKIPFDIYHGWNDNSYSIAQEFILSNNKFNSHPPPRKNYTKQELSKRMTGLTNQELESAIEGYYTDPSRLY